MRFSSGAGSLGDPVAKGRRRHPSLYGDCSVRSDPVGVDVYRDMVHSKLDALDVVLRHFGIHLIEMGRGFPTVRLDLGLLAGPFQIQAR